MKILGIRVGQPGFVRAFFGTEVGGTRFAVRADSSRGGSTISMVDLGHVRRNEGQFLRGVQPALTESFAETHACGSVYDRF